MDLAYTAGRLSCDLLPTEDRLFQSFFMGGFEGSAHRREDRRQLDLIAATRHDVLATQDYAALFRCGISTVRDAVRWHLIETSPGRYCWDSLFPMLEAARRQGMQVIWDLCHYGLPHDIDIWSDAFVQRFAAFAAAAADLLGQESDLTPVYCPMNEISYWTWAGGEHGLMYPFARGEGLALKRQLVRAAVAGITAVRAVDPRARFVQAEPLINVVGRPEQPGDAEAAEAHRQAQYEVFDMLAGQMCPELGGQPDCLDIVGVNFYFNNQWFRNGPTIPLGDPAYRPLRSLLGEVVDRYRRPVLITETGTEGESGAGWLRYVAGEVRAAQRAGATIEGVCLYPVMDYPAWDNERHCCCGLLRTDPAWQTRSIDPAVHAQIREEQALMALAGL
jgi:beta-glucosidase/6-phospho-beta-glucosidase/beta-galactosidase